MNKANKLNKNAMGISTTEFSIKLNKKCFKKEDILNVSKFLKDELIVLEKPYKSNLNKFLQFITFGIYKAPWQYKVKLLNNNCIKSFNNEQNNGNR